MNLDSLGVCQIFNRFANATNNIFITFRLVNFTFKYYCISKKSVYNSSKFLEVFEVMNAELIT